MFDKKIDKFTNYNAYWLGAWDMPGVRKEVDESQLMRIIEGCKSLLKKPYLRFIWTSVKAEAVCFVYDGDTRLTRLVSLSEIEKMIACKDFTKYPSATQSKK